MGWAYGTNAEGRKIGYGVEAKCDKRGCKTRISRGISNVCGGMHDGGNHGCGKYFCWTHLYALGNLCEGCMKSLPGCATCGLKYVPGEDDECFNCSESLEEDK